MPEQCGDRFERHAPVDALGGQRVTEGVGVDVTDAGPAGHGGDVAVDGAPVHGLMVVTLDDQAGGGRSAPGPVVVDQADEHRVKRDGPFVVQLAGRDAQPAGVAESVHGVVSQTSQLSDAHAGAGEEFDDQPAPPVRFGSHGGRPRTWPPLSRRGRTSGAARSLWAGPRRTPALAAVRRGRPSR